MAPDTVVCLRGPRLTMRMTPISRKPDLATALREASFSTPTFVIMWARPSSRRESAMAVQAPGRDAAAAGARGGGRVLEHHGVRRQVEPAARGGQHRRALPVDPAAEQRAAVVLGEPEVVARGAPRAHLLDPLAHLHGSGQLVVARAQQPDLLGQLAPRALAVQVELVPDVLLHEVELGAGEVERVPGRGADAVAAHSSEDMPHALRCTHLGQCIVVFGYRH